MPQAAPSQTAVPQIRDLQALIAEQQASLQPQFALLDEDIARNTAAGAAQEAGLEAKKVKEFGNIEQRANDKGMLFSGFTPDEQAKYTADTYLPALAQLQATIAQTRSNLLGKKADLGKSAFDTAFQTREGDIGRKFTWDSAETQRQFESNEAVKAAIRAEEAASKQRAFESEQLAKKLAAEAAEAERNRASQKEIANIQARAAAASAAAKSAANQPTPSQNMAQALSAKVGSDGYVSPGTWQSLKSQWIAGGYGDAKAFDNTFAGYRNPKNPYYKVG